MTVPQSLVFAAVTVTLGAGTHAAAGGAAPDAIGLLVLITATAALGWPLFRRSLRTPTLLGAVTLSQVALHPAFQALSAGTASGHHEPGSGWQMLGAHVIAAVLAALLVTALDPMLRCLQLRHVPRRLAPIAGPVATTVRTLPPDTVRADSPGRAVLLSAPRRGPPRRARFA